MKSCPCRNCNHVVGDGQPVCAAHWRQVPEALKGEIWQSWARLGERESRGPERLLRLQAHRELVRRAVAEVSAHGL